MIDEATVIAPENIQELQHSLTKTNLSDFPSELKQNFFPFWLLWSPTPNNFKSPNKPCTKLLKKPTNPRWQDPSETMKYVDLLEIYEKRMRVYYDSLDKQKVNYRHKVPIPVAFGFKYTDDHPFVCFDLDAVNEEHEQLVDDLQSYTEWSPSGEGAHVIVRVPTVKDKLTLIEMFSRGKRRTDVHRDLFIASGYVTVTGLTLPTKSKEIRTLDLGELELIINKYYAPTNVVKHPSLVEQEQETTKEIYDAAKPKGKQALGGTKHKPVPATKVRNMLNEIPVKCLESDIFERLQNNEMAIINYECEEEAREPWLIIGQAIHHNFNGGLEGYVIWNEWSQQGNKYDSDASEATWKSFKDIENPVTIAALFKLYLAQRPQFPDRTAKGALVPSLPNFDTYIKFYKYQCQQNEISKSLSVVIPDYVKRKLTLDTNSTQALSLRELAEYIHSDLHTHGFALSAYNPAKIGKFLTVRCRDNLYNPIRDYFEDCGAKWDKTDYISQLLDTVKINPAFLKYIEALHMFLRKWLIQVAAAACYDPGKQSIQLNRVLIFSGPQGVGKTLWVKSLFPKRLREYCAADKDIRITGFRSDNVKMTMELVKILICNINEIDRLFNYSNFSEVKAFFEKTEDNIVLPYGETDTIMTRRTVFIGSTNRDDFLIDPSGNRRFEIIPTIKLNFKHGIDLDQLWGQVYNMYNGGEKWWFDPDDPKDIPYVKARDEINSQSMFIVDDAFAEELDRIFDAEEGQRTGKYKKMDFASINRHLTLGDFRRNSKSFRLAKQAVATWSKMVTNRDPVYGKGIRPRQYYYMPPLRTNDDPIPEDPEETIIKDERTELMKQMKLLQMRLKRLNKEEASDSGSS